MNISIHAVRRNRGFSLLEVLVALLVLSIGLLGLAMLQAQGLKFNGDAYSRTQATILAYDLIDRMRLNSKAASLGDYSVAAKPNFDKSLCESGSGCTNTDDLAKYDLVLWFDALTKALPGASAQITGPNAGQSTITLRWYERDLPVAQTWTVQL